MRKFLLIAMVMFTLPVFAQNYNMRLASIASNDGIEIWDYIYSAPDNTHLVCINEMEFATPLEIVDSLEYDERGNITKLSTWQKTEGGWIYACYVEYEYNDKNQKIVSKNYNDWGTGFELGGIYRYSYDEEGRMSEWTLEFAGVEEFNKGIIEYNEAGYKVSETLQQYNFATYYLENANLTEYEYDANNNVTRIAVSAWDAGVWTLQSATVNEYDEYGNCIVSEKRTSTGTVQERKLFEYDLNILAENVFYYPNPKDDFPQLPAGRKHLLKSFEFYAQNADDMQLSYVTTYELSYEVIEGSENPGGDDPSDDEEITCTITAVANPEEGGTITGAGTYMKDMTVKLKAKANEGYEFLNWTENDVIVSIDAEYLFEITKDRNLVANFEEIEDPENPGGNEPEQPGDSVVLVAPVVVADTVTETTVVLVWNAIDSATSYNVYMDSVLVKNVTDTVCTVDSLTTETTYSFMVTVVADTLESEFSNVVTVTTLKAEGEEPENPEEPEEPGDEPEEPIELDAPENVEAKAISTSSIIITWDKVENALSYNIYRDGELLDDTENTNYTDENLEYDTEYCYTIEAVNGKEISDKSEEVCVKTLGEGVEEHETSFNIYPNPVNDKLYIETLTQTQTLTVEIYDVYGRQQSMVNGQQSTVIDVTDLNSGVYFVKVVTSEGETVKRFIKK